MRAASSSLRIAATSRVWRVDTMSVAPMSDAMLVVRCATGGNAGGASAVTKR